MKIESPLNPCQSQPRRLRTLINQSKPRALRRSSRDACARRGAAAPKDATRAQAGSRRGRHEADVFHLPCKLRLRLYSPAIQLLSPRALPQGPRSLDEIAKLPLLQLQETSKIAGIWNDFHRDKDDVVATTLEGAATFRTLLKRGKQSPLFVFPVSVVGGGPTDFSVLVSQFQEKHCLLTSYEDYNTKGVDATPHVVATFYDELLAEKDIVLVRTEVVNPAMPPETARTINEALISAYLTAEGYEKVEQFNHNPQDFPIEEYLADPQNRC